jgi:hypothetical protein
MKPDAWITDNGNLTFSCPFPYDPNKLTQDGVSPLYAIDFTKYKLVPIEPTYEQEIAGIMLFKKDLKNDFADPCLEQNLYKAMIEAAPKIEDL